MTARLYILLAIITVSAQIVLPLPVAVKNVAKESIENYIIFFTVERDLLFNEGIDPATMCAIDQMGEYLPIWVPSEVSIVVWLRVFVNKTRS